MNRTLILEANMWQGEGGHYQRGAVTGYAVRGLPDGEGATIVTTAHDRNEWRIVFEDKESDFPDAYASPQEALAALQTKY